MSTKQYNLYVHVKSGSNLVAMDFHSGKSDPYCKVSYGNNTHQTKFIPKTLDPTWNETFLFHPKELKGMLLFELWDHDFLTPDDFMGSVFIRLENVELSHVTKTFTLDIEGKKLEKWGQITVSIALQEEVVK